MKLIPVELLEPIRVKTGNGKIKVIHMKTKIFVEEKKLL